MDEVWCEVEGLYCIMLVKVDKIEKEYDGKFLKLGIEDVEECCCKYYDIV